MTATVTASFTAGALAERLQGELVGPPELELTHLAPIESAGSGALTFIRSENYARRWADSGASGALVSEGIDIPEHDPASRALIIVPDADIALVQLLELVAPEPEPIVPGVHDSAVVHPDASIGQGVAIGPHCTIEAGATIGDATVLESNITIGRNVTIGRGCALQAGVVIRENTQLGDGCILHANVTIGADGFGYRPDPSGQGLLKIPHLGNVVVGRGVEIGAGSNIDRAKFGSTTIGDGTKIDSLVQVGHGCQIGRCCILCGCVAIAGSVVMEDGVTIGGSTCVADNIHFGAGSKVTGGSAVITDIPRGEIWTGVPAGPAKQTLANMSAFRDLYDFMREAKGKKPLFRKPSS